ncbi:protein of unknown function (DUF1844) [Terriglobus roseus DSM 18391]|uniref:DUF1844 domain-containing protein n=1 Tax=Terriglobus roseus (strain DSM 18391 / NRRL B-41598 / KBS 63) TaxID=926566 RepID=I3ZL72_TERRK|nr:DUF1844 domain-containing protein [Terriglobus roseus]AFL89990.1 protein of unknown function (DUF1844) [Terriglobus roseus DSM 18391]
MSEQEQNKPFVINDRRKFRMDGEPRETPAESPAATVAETPAAATEPVAANVTEMPAPAVTEPAEAPAHKHHNEPIPFNSAHSITPVPEPAEEETAAAESTEGEPDLPPPPTEEEMQQVRLAYETTSERLDTMVRSQNLGAEHPPAMDFTQLVQSIYMSAMMQLGAGTQQGQQARVDILGAKQSIDMLGIIGEKTSSNLTDVERRLIDAALFELRMGFLEITQLLARQAQAKQGPPPAGPGTGGSGFGGGGFTGGGPRIVR